jgi:hypothetical protein
MPIGAPGGVEGGRLELAPNQIFFAPVAGEGYGFGILESPVSGWFPEDGLPSKNIMGIAGLRGAVSACDGRRMRRRWRRL